MTQTFFPEIRKQMLADSHRRQAREGGSGGIVDLVSPKRPGISPCQNNEGHGVGDFIVDGLLTAESPNYLSEIHLHPDTASGSPHRVKAAAVAMAEAASAVEEVVTEEVSSILSLILLVIGGLIGTFQRYESGYSGSYLIGLCFPLSPEGT